MKTFVHISPQVCGQEEEPRGLNAITYISLT